MDDFLVQCCRAKKRAVTWIHAERVFETLCAVSGTWSCSSSREQPNARAASPLLPHCPSPSRGWRSPSSHQASSAPRWKVGSLPTSGLQPCAFTCLWARDGNGHGGHGWARSWALLDSHLHEIGTTLISGLQVRGLRCSVPRIFGRTGWHGEPSPGSLLARPVLSLPRCRTSCKGVGGGVPEQKVRPSRELT